MYQLLPDMSDDNPMLKLYELIVLNLDDKFCTAYELTFLNTYATFGTDRMSFVDFTNDYDEPDLPWDVRVDKKTARLIRKKNERFFDFLDNLYRLDRKASDSREILVNSFTKRISLKP